MSNWHWESRTDGYQSNRINGTYYVRQMGGPLFWFAEWCGLHDMDILCSYGTTEECMSACNEHYRDVIREEYDLLFGPEDRQG